MRPPIELEIGDTIILRKAHACGGKKWRIDRVGADIGITCMTCGRYVLLPRSRLERSIQQHFPQRATPSNNGT